MSGRVLLDTNIVIALFAKEAVVEQHLAETKEVFISSIVLGELYYGAQKSARVETNIARVNTFAAGSAVLVCDTATAQYYGAIKNQLPPPVAWICVVQPSYCCISQPRRPR